MISMEEAKLIVLSNLERGTKITAAIDHGDEYMFIAIQPDVMEGRFDPFFKVDKLSTVFIDFSPQEYEDSREILKRLLAQGGG